jgi:hypothetical protein
MGRKRKRMNPRISLVIGLAVGSGIGYLIARKQLDAKYAQIAQEEIDSVREYYRRMLDGSSCDELEDDDQDNDDTVDAVIAEESYDKTQNFRHSPSPLVRSSLDENKSEKAKRDYQIHKPQPEVVRARVDPPEPPVEPGPGPSIYEISDEDYSETHNEYDKISLYYHRFDGILCDEQEELVDDIGRTISVEIEEGLFNRNGAVYVRNDNIAADYEIVIMNSSYSEHHTDTPPMSSRRRRSRDEEQDED